MPRYRFIVRNGSRHDDPEGTVLRDDKAARNYAIQVTRDLKKNNENGWKGWTLEVTASGRRVWQIPFLQVIDSS